MIESANCFSCINLNKIRVVIRRQNFKKKKKKEKKKTELSYFSKFIPVSNANVRREKIDIQLYPLLPTLVSTSQ